MCDFFAIIGPTASGKSQIGKQLIRNNFCIVNFDSCQLYSKLPILKAVPNDLNEHYLYQIFDHENRRSVIDWIELCKITVDNIFSLNKKRPLLIGGTGFYLKSLCEGIVNLPCISKEIETKVDSLSDKQIIVLLEKFDPLSLKFQDQRRLRRSLKIYLQTNKKISEYNEKIYFNLGNIHTLALLPDISYVKENIKLRLQRDFDLMIFEVEELLKNENLNSYNAVIGVNEIEKLLKGEIDKKKCEELIFFRTCHYAKRQYTYVRNCLNVEKIFFKAENLLEYIENSCD